MEFEKPKGYVRFKGPRAELSYGSAGFPRALMDIPKPPRTLHVLGNPEALREGLAVVGARKATPYGKAAAKMFAGHAARLGVSVISGGARGCDSYAHEAALEAGGVTVAFLGGGCDVPYPARNADLFQRIITAGGALVSEYDWEMPALPYGFRARNRLIAGLARATLIVEAGMPSGTFSTADEALAANREVLAVPGSIFSKTSLGSNALIAQGATPLADEASLDAVLARLFPSVVPMPDTGGQLALSCDSCERGAGGGEGSDKHGVGMAASFALPQDARKTFDPVLAAFQANPMKLEELVEVFSDPDAECALGVSDLMSAVVTLEAMGAIERFADGRFGATVG